MTARRISLGFLLAVTLAWAMDKDNLSVANDAQPVSDAHAQEDGIRNALKASWPIHAFVRRPRMTGPNERRNGDDAKDGVGSQKIHRRSRRNFRSSRNRYKSRGTTSATWSWWFILVAFVLPTVILLSIFASVGIALCCYYKKRNNNQPAHAGRVIQPAQPSVYRAQPMSQPRSE
ncbi:hypothetical protein AAVH_06082 [Aphelenchoides avenae]|nr:hypothetical protein AAVH_06082 [Aphelenchus avenae]